MVGAFAGYYLSSLVPRGSLTGGITVMIGAMVICAVLGILIERLAYRPLRTRSKLTVLITAIGVSLFLENTGQFLFTANPKAFPALFPQSNFKLGELVVASSQMIVLAVTVGLLAGLQFIV